MKHLVKLAVVFLVIGSAMGLLWANNGVGDEPAAIMVSPSTIVLAKVDIISVHTNIPRADVVDESLELNGVAPTDVCADNLGQLVAKFAVADLDLEPGEATLTLSGDIIDDDVVDSFEASDVVRVK